MKQYIEDAQRTKSPNFFTDHFSPWEIEAILADAIDSGKHVDVLKKALFYNKAPDKAVYDNYFAGGMFGDVDAEISHIPVDVIHSILGSFTEGVELLELLHKAMTTGEQIDGKDLIDESGDALWYMAMCFHHLGTTFQEAADANIRKLMARFPDKFDETRANVRNLEAERQALSAAQ